MLRQFGAEVRNVGDTVDLAGAADIVLVDRIEDTSFAGVTHASEYLSLVEQLNTSVWVTASAYGVQNSRGNAVGSELTTLASGGILGHSRSGDEAIPTVPAGDIALKLTGLTMALAALHGVHIHRDRSVPVHIDLSAQAAVVSTGLCLEMAHALAQCPDSGGSSRYGAPTGFFDCREGRIYVVVLEQHQWERLRSCLHPQLDAIPTLEEARRRSDEVNDAVAAWFSTRTNIECEQALQSVGVPCTSVNSVNEFYRRAHQAGRSISDEGPGVSAIPAVVTERDDDPRKEEFPSLQSLRVLDAGHVLAVPLAAAWLGAMGAQVTKLEDPQRLDVYRRRGPFVAGTDGPNRSAYFNHVNFCKQSLDMQVEPTGSTLDATPFDVILHNLTPRRAKVVGVAAAKLPAVNNPRLSVTSSGFGATGQWAEYRAYGHNIHAFAGLVAATRDSTGALGDVGTPWADPLTGVAVATWVLAWSIAGARSHDTAVDLSMAELMAAQLTDLDGAADYYRPRSGSADFFVRTRADGRTVAITLQGTGDIEVFETLTGARFALPPTRGSMVEPIALGALEALDAYEIAQRLRCAGLAAEVVQTARDLAGDDFLASTGLLQMVTSDELGSYKVSGLPWMVVGTGRAPLTAAPERP
ncbi:CoA transferase [Rhodococcus opacus]|uniref:CoA transferase n=1 Tax=Rhodococcus opacus TaxID=37919 RepID=UPI0018E4BA1D|nr:CoA transferase [Rhodococcus opacus]